MGAFRNFFTFFHDFRQNVFFYAKKSVFSPHNHDIRVKKWKNSGKFPEFFFGICRNFCTQGQKTTFRESKCVWKLRPCTFQKIENKTFFKRCFYEIWGPNVQKFKEFEDILWNLLEIWAPNFTKAPLEKNFFLKSTRSQLSNALRFMLFWLFEQNEHYFLPWCAWSYLIDMRFLNSWFMKIRHSSVPRRNGKF